VEDTAYFKFKLFATSGGASYPILESITGIYIDSTDPSMLTSGTITTFTLTPDVTDV
jgi:hypothetical protein